MTSIAQWHMDHAIFGNPTFNLRDAPDDTFHRGPGEVGSGQYEILHWSKPHQIGLTWQMAGTDFNAFVLAWNDVNQLCFGANWFTLDAPLQIDGGGVASVPNTMLSVSKFLGVNVVVSGTKSGYDAAAGMGSLTAVDCLGRRIKGVHIDTATDTGTIETFDGAFPTPNDTSIKFCPRTPSQPGVELDLAYQGGNVYSLTGVAALSDWGTVWGASDGQLLMAEMHLQVPSWQRYVCHWNGPYQATRIGFDEWEITGQLEVQIFNTDLWKAA